MKEEFFYTYQVFDDRESAIELTEILSKHDIAYVLEEDTVVFNVHALQNNEYNKKYFLKLAKDSFELADKVLYNHYEIFLNQIGSDYYLYSFSNDELIDILAKRDEWGKIDFLLAQKILKERNVNVNQQTLDKLKDNRIEQLSKPMAVSNLWKTIGYLSAIVGGFISNLLGTIPIVLGLSIVFYKKTLPNGERVWGYSSKDRAHGRAIFILGMIFFIAWIFYRKQFLGYFFSNAV